MSRPVAPARRRCWRCCRGAKCHGRRRFHPGGERRMSHYLRLGIIPGYLALCLVLGGASAAGYWANMALQLLAIPIIVWACAAKRANALSTPAKQLIGLLSLMLLVMALQLVPLPPSIWALLPGRQPVVEGFRLIGEPLPW